MFIIGTAGHIDHGKSALVQRLTGIDPDRLVEEKERGMTIDLGFAWLKLSSGSEIGIIDVPGHEKFIKNMLAGVGSIDLVLFIVAANEGIMPQTREHLEILNLLGIKLGIVVITKIDLVDEEILSLVKLEVEELFKNTFLEKAPVVAVSSTTGEGIAILLDKIENLLKDAEPRKNIGRPRLFVDRVFTIMGAGTVVTGTLIDGSLAINQEVEILPSRIKARIRGLQSHKMQRQIVEPGNRVAINLANVTPSQIARGDVITHPGWLIPSSRFDCKLILLKSVINPLKHGAEVSLFLGSAEVLAKIHLLDNEEIKANAIAWIQVTTDKPLPAQRGDHFIIRSPVSTLGGGFIINPMAKRHKRYKPEVIIKLRQMESEIPEEVILAILSFKPYIRLWELYVISNLTKAQVDSAVDKLLSDGRVISVREEKDKIIFSSAHWQEVAHKANEILVQYHYQNSTRPGMPKGEFANKIGLTIASPVLKKLVHDKVVIEDGINVRHPDYHISLTEDQTKKIDLFLKALQKNQYSPQVDSILDQDLLNHLVENQVIVKITDGIYFLRSTYDEMIARISSFIQQNGKVTVGEVRDMFNTSRKYAIALLEYLDEKKITKRIGDNRIMR